MYKKSLSSRLRMLCFAFSLLLLYSAMTSEGEENAYSKHNVFWTERDANNKAYDYFQRHGYLLF